MKIRVVELPYNGARIKGGPERRRLKKGFYLVFGKEVLSGPHKSAQNCYEARGEWYEPGERLTS